STRYLHHSASRWRALPRCEHLSLRCAGARKGAARRSPEYPLCFLSGPELPRRRRSRTRPAPLQASRRDGGLRRRGVVLALPGRQIEERMEYDWPEVMDSYLAAWQYQPDRAGPLYRIAMHYQGLGEYHIAHMFFTRALKIPRPAPSRLFVENTIYDYQLLLEYGVACYYVGDHPGAIEANNPPSPPRPLPPHAPPQLIP